MFYKYIFDNFEPTIKTTDIDFYVPDSKAIKERKGLIKSMRDINYDIVYDALTNKSIFISPDGFEIEFLTKAGRNRLMSVKLGNTNVYAEPLSYIELFSSHYIDVQFENIKLKIASPPSYIIEKLLIIEKRGSKKEKDIETIKNVLFYVGASRKYKLELKSLYESLPKKWKKKISLTITNYNITLFN